MNIKQSHKDTHYSLKKHKNGYYYIMKNQTYAITKTDEMKKDKQKIKRLERALEGRSLRTVNYSIYAARFQKALILVARVKVFFMRPAESNET